ncbi:universal stress protein [Paenarthrobacter nitroguajacolicus]|uniref:universal stress protein n=1 Tax=Paenarthrobacter nitroguajacolicus TaxID=211146 RepID=UPI00286241D9|nr:universal stress protein [Paenarthrobacter nitroguajacolicus]MDR6636869.1 nucleotide-binding universal stress UspA family protein [Paenarthrobacter nitroguajacolicus]
MKKQILVALDGFRASGHVADWAAARADSLGVGLALVHVVPKEWAYPRQSDHQMALLRAEDLLGSETSRLEEAFPGLAVTQHRLSGEPAETIALLSSDYELVVVGTDCGPGTEGQGYGSVSFQVAVTSTGNVAVIPAARPSVREGVVVGVDGSAESLNAMDYGAGEALRLGEDLILIHASGPNAQLAGDADVLDVALQRVNRQYPGVTAKARLDPAHGPGEALVDAARDAQLLVIGCKGRGGLRVLLGSVAQHVLLHVQCPTILTRAGEKGARGS